MRLLEAIQRLRELDDDATIFARRPWTEQSECDVVVLDEEYRPPATVAERGLDYFLEVHLASEVLEVLDSRDPSDAEKLLLLCYFAENDAYPDWAFDPSMEPGTEFLGPYPDPDRVFYDALGDERTSVRCAKPGCSRGAITLSVLCRPHHFEMIQRKPCPFSD